MKYLRAILFAICAVFLASCDSDSETSGYDMSSFVSGTSETTWNFTKVDTSSWVFATDVKERPDVSFSPANHWYYLVQGNGSRKNYISNWVVSRNYKLITGCGVTASVKTGPMMNYAGFEIFKKNSYDCYRFRVYADGRFMLEGPSGKYVNLKAGESRIMIGGFNKIQAMTTDKGNVLVFVNGHQICSFKASEMDFPLTNSEIIAVCYNVNPAATTANPGEAWVKITEIQQKKN